MNESSRYAGESVVKVDGHRCRKKAIKAGENDTRHDIAVVRANEQSMEMGGWSAEHDNRNEKGLNFQKLYSSFPRLGFIGSMKIEIHHHNLLGFTKIHKELSALQNYRESIKLVHHKTRYRGSGNK